MKCKNCNIELSSDSFCPSCGKTVTELQNLGLIKQNQMMQDSTVNTVQPNSPIQPANNFHEPNTSLETTESNIQPEMSNEPQRISGVQNINSESQNDIITPNQTYQTFNDLHNQVQALDPNINQPPSINEQTKPKHNYFVTVILIILLLAALAFGGWFLNKVLTKPTAHQIFEIAILDLYSNINTVLDQDVNTVSGNYSIKTNIKYPDENTGILDLINSIFLNFEYGMDFKNKVGFVSMDSKYQDSELLKADIYFENNKGYAFLHNTYDKYISSDIEDYESIFLTDTTDYQKIILREIKTALIASLKDEYFIKEQKENIIKNTLCIDSNNFPTMYNSIMSYLNNSQEFKTNFSKLFEIEEQELNKIFQEALSKPQNFDENVLYRISISIDNRNNKFVGFEYKKLDGDIESIFTIDKKDDENYFIDVYDESKKTLDAELTVKKSENNTNIIYSMNIEKMTIGFDLNYSVKYNEPIKKFDVSNSIDYNTLTETDYKIMYENIMKKEGFKKIKSVTEIFWGSIKEKIIHNTLCSQAYNCQEGLNGMSDCNYIDTKDGIEKNIQCQKQ